MPETPEKAEVTLAREEWNRLLTIEALVRLVVENSTGFCSAWEFNSHDMSTRPEEWHERLKELLAVYCPRCGASCELTHRPDAPCSTCTGELVFTPVRTVSESCPRCGKPFVRTDPRSRVCPDCVLSMTYRPD